MGATSIVTENFHRETTDDILNLPHSDGPAGQGAGKHWGVGPADPAADRHGFPAQETADVACTRAASRAASQAGTGALVGEGPAAPTR